MFTGSTKSSLSRDKAFLLKHLSGQYSLAHQRVRAANVLRFASALSFAVAEYSQSVSANLLEAYHLVPQLFGELSCPLHNEFDWPFLFPGFAPVPTSALFGW